MKWKQRPCVEDRKPGPKRPHSTVLSIEEEAVIVAFRCHTLLPLDDRLYSLQPRIPHLTRSSLQRPAVSRLPEVDGGKPERKRFKRYPIGYIHIHIAEVRTEGGKLRLFVAMDRTWKLVCVELHERADKMITAQFLRNPIKMIPCEIHTILTHNGIRFTNRKQGTTAFEHIFDRVC